MSLLEKSSVNNGVLVNSYDYTHSENGKNMDEASAIMLQPIDGQNNSPVPVVVSYGPGARTSTSVPQIVNFSQKSNLIRGRCYCKIRQIKSKIIILVLAVLVMGTAIGALIMYFSSNFQCSNKTSKYNFLNHLMLIKFSYCQLV